MKLSQKRVLIITVTLIIVVVIFGIFYYLGTRHEFLKFQEVTSSNTKITPAQAQESTPSAKVEEVAVTPSDSPTPTKGIIQIKTPLHILPISTNTPTPTPTTSLIQLKQPIIFQKISP
jgi:hypothetical protein